MKDITEMLKGVLEGVILEIISRGETYGYEITKTIQDLGFEDIVEGTVYTVLIRLEKNDWVNTVKRKSDIGPMRKFYSLNETGRKELARFWDKWGLLD
ncbi:PadR family transcriptional regulator [Lentilactobacillus senioris]|uniref:PadR family transcriptional regulator n=1 Tax=Lentilactobacillus senioris TaxID=931534 RepID=UPI0006D1BDBF|nr:PadR family transcriptional regulator [Lentilactobacillus senioris]